MLDLQFEDDSEVVISSKQSWSQLWIYLFICSKLYISWPAIWIIISVVLLPAQILWKTGNFLFISMCQALCCETQTHISSFAHISLSTRNYTNEVPKGVYERSLRVYLVGQYSSRSLVHIATCSENHKQMSTT